MKTSLKLALTFTFTFMTETGGKGFDANSTFLHRTSKARESHKKKQLKK
jgi:hypothetical protein